MMGAHAIENNINIAEYKNMTVLLLKSLSTRVHNIIDIKIIVINVENELGLNKIALSISPCAIQIHPLVRPHEAQGTPYVCKNQQVGKGF